MKEQLTYVELATCNCKFTIKYTTLDGDDVPTIESLESFKSKCAIHESLGDVAAFVAALDMARTTNLGEDYVIENMETVGE